MHLERRKIKSKTYYYVVKKARINGKVKTIKQIYIGSAEKILELVTKQPEQLIQTCSFGAVILLLYIEKVIGFESIVNEVLKERKNRVTGRYLLIYIFNRVLEPTSNNKMDDWLKTTVLGWLWDIKLNSQILWNHLSYLKVKEINVIEDKIIQKVLPFTNDNEYLWDTTNHFTYINNSKSKLLGKGKSKQGRHNKYLISHGLLVGKDSELPLKCIPFKYMHDSKVFREKIGELKSFLKSISRKKFTLIIDKGNNSKKNFKVLRKYDFIGSLRKEQVKNLLKIPLENYKELYQTSKKRRVHGFESEKVMYDIKCKVVVTYMKETHKQQLMTFNNILRKTKKQYKKEIENKYFRTEDSARNAINKILPHKYKLSFTKEFVKENGKWKVILKKNTENIRHYNSGFGKNTIFTNKLKANTIDIVKAYKSLSKVESQFKILHNAMLIPLTPFYCWTDQKIRAHIFLCYIALLYVKLLELIAGEKGLEKNFSSLLKKASKIRLGLITDGKKAHYQFERMTLEQQKIMEAFKLSQFANF